MTTISKSDDGSTMVTEFTMGDVHSIVNDEIGKKMSALLDGTKTPTEAMVTVAVLLATVVSRNVMSSEQAMANIDSLSDLAKAVSESYIAARGEFSKKYGN